jgi:hypothetical protein
MLPLLLDDHVADVVFVVRRRRLDPEDDVAIASPSNW